MNQNELDILVKFIIDQTAKGKFASETADVAAAMKKLSESSPDDLFKMNDADADKLFAAMKQQIEYETQRQDAMRETMRVAQAEARYLRAQASAIQDDMLKFRIARLNQQSQQIGAIGGALFAGGAGIVGGIFATASKYVKDAKEATEVTKQWKAAQDSLERSGQKVGAVLAETALPLLKQVARIAAQAADFIDRNPQIAQAALNAGLIVAEIGAVGIAVSKGIKLYADALYLSTVPTQMAAARLQAEAANKQFIAAQMRARLAGVPEGAGEVSKGTSLLGNIPGAVKIGALVLASAAEILALSYGLAKLVEVTTGVKLPLLVFIDKIKQLKDQLTGQTTGPTVGVSGSASFGGGVASNKNRDELLKAYEDYKADDLKLVQDHYRDRQKIISDSQNAESSSNQKYLSGITKIQNDRANSLAQAAQNYANSEKQAETQYQTQRAQMVRDGEIEIQNIRQQSQERLQKLERDHNNRMDDFARARDALGLVKEQRAYNQAKADEKNSTALEIQQRRRDLAIRLSDQAKAYEQERAQRLAEYQARVEEINAQARQRMQELQDEHQAELRQIRLDRINKLKELDAAFVDERKRRTQQFIATIRDLDASLLGEQNLRKKYQDAMLKELDAFLASYKTKMGTLASAPTAKASGGYATYGTYLLGDKVGGGKGKPEYVLNGDTTAALERAFGASITQDRIIQLAALMGRGGGGNQIQYTDQRRINSAVSIQDRNAMMDETIESISGVFESLSRR